MVLRKKSFGGLQRSIQVTLSKLQVVVLIVFFHITPYLILQMEMFTPSGLGKLVASFQENILRLIFVCHFGLYSAFHIQDNSDLLLSQEEADATSQDSKNNLGILGDCWSGMPHIDSQKTVGMITFLVKKVDCLGSTVYL